ncbi:MAG: ElyC/SanA/YdcF family protein, partial [Planctomycetota bacterium]
MGETEKAGTPGELPAEPVPSPAPKRRRRRRIALALGAVFVLGVLGLAGSWALVSASASGRLYADVSAIPHRRVAVVLGCVKTLSDGRSNQFFRARIRAAATLFRAGKADVLLVSGDNGRHGYDEPTDMRESLIAAGIPADRIVCDFAGFRTLDSAVRAKEVFGQSEVT